MQRGATFSETGAGHHSSKRLDRQGCDKPCFGQPLTVTSLTFVDSACIDMIRAGTMRSNNTNGVLQPPSVGLWQAACFKKWYYLGGHRLREQIG